MADRYVTAVVRDKRGRVVKLYAPGEEWSPVASAEAAIHIASGAHHYWVDAGGGDAVEVRPFRRVWVRTVPDAEGVNNLDELPPPNYALTRTGAYDAVVTVSASALERLGREMHAAGVIEDRRATAQEGQVVELVLGPPVVEPYTDDGDDSAFVVEREALCWASDVSRADDPGFSAVVTTRAVARTKTRAPDADGVAGFELRYAAHPDDAVTVHTPLDPARRAIVEAAAGTFLSDARTDVWTFTMPGELGTLVRVRPAFAGSGDLQIGLGFDATAGEFGLPQAGAPADWAISLSRAYLASRVYATLATELGAAPPPAGAAPVLLDAAENLYLDLLELGLGNGLIVLSGRLRRDATPEVTATFRAEFALALTATGLVTAELGEVDVEVGEWYAQLFDFLSGSALTNALKKGLRTALSGDSGSGSKLASFFSADLIRSLATAGTERTVSLTPKVTGVDVSPAGLQIRGDLNVRARPRPRALLRVQSGPSGAPAVLYGGASAVPGGDVSEARWDFGDGSQAQLGGSDRALVAGHVYASGGYSAKLTVVGDDGQEHSATAKLKVP